MKRFSFALNYTVGPTGRAARTSKPRMTKVDMAKLKAKYMMAEKADKNYWKKKGKPGRPKGSKNKVPKELEKALDKVTESKLAKLEPNKDIQSALKTASKMELKSSGPSRTMHGSGPWIDALGREGLKFFSSRTTESTKNNLVDQTIGFGNKNKCYTEHIVLGEPKAMPISRIALSNKTPLFDTSFRAFAGMDSGFYKSEMAKPIKAGININTHRVFYNPLTEQMIRRLRTPGTGTGEFRSAPYACDGTGTSTKFDVPSSTNMIGKMSIYTPYNMKDKYIFSNLEKLTNCVISIKLVQFYTEKDNGTNDPKVCVDQMTESIPEKFMPEGKSGTGAAEGLKRFVQDADTIGTGIHHSFGQQNETGAGASEFYTLKGYSIRDSKIASQMNVLKTSTRTLRPGETWQYQIDSYVNRNIQEAGNGNQYAGFRDCINDTYHIMVSVKGTSCLAYNARPTVTGTAPESWKIVDRNFIRCNSTALVSVRQQTTYEDYSFREPQDNNPSTTQAPELFVKQYRSKPEAGSVSQTIYCFPENVVTEENISNIPSGNNKKFLIPISTRAEIVNSGIAKA